MRLLILLLTLCCSNTLFAQENSLLWEIEHNETKQKSYIFGTIHFIPESYFNISDSLMYCINAAEEVYLEIKLGPINNLLEISDLLNELIMPNETLLSQLLTEEEFEQVRSRMEEMNIPLFFYNKIQPMFLATYINISENSDNKKETVQKTVSYDMEINNIAHAKEKPINGLESIEFQLKLLNCIPLKEQAKYLVSEISNENRQNKPLNLFEVYERQDLASLKELIADPNLPEHFYELMLDKRNKNWVEQIKEIGKTKTCLYAVGAAHLIGENGILELLNEDGFSIRPMINY